MPYYVYTFYLDGQASMLDSCCTHDLTGFSPEESKALQLDHCAQLQRTAS
jgi:hypothetical protein